MDVRAYLAERAALVDRFLERHVPPADAEPPRLHAAMRHLLFPGGKRLRPALALAACEAAGSPPERALPVAAAVELVHTYSLVHDDLPCMDDDSERRGRPTVHVAFGEALAVLAGDALLARAFEVLAREGAGVAPEARIAALAGLAAAAGSQALVGGQADDLVFPPDGSAAAVEAVHERKTAALFSAATGGGARFGGAPPPLSDRLGRFGLELGAAFQIADDLLDRDTEEPCSLVRTLGVASAQERARVRLARGLAELEDLGERAEPLRELARYAVLRER